MTDGTQGDGCGASMGKMDRNYCEHMSVQGCMLPYGCVHWDEEANEQARIEYEDERLW